VTELISLPAKWRAEAKDYGECKASVFTQVADELDQAIHDDQHEAEFMPGCPQCREEIERYGDGEGKGKLPPPDQFDDDGHRRP
jgi:hypothetical protein